MGRALVVQAAHAAALAREAVVDLGDGLRPACGGQFISAEHALEQATRVLQGLALETAHARQALGVSPRWGLDTAVARTMAWYRAQQGGADARALCLADLDAWEVTA